jgi:hypothetical protein
MDTSYYIDKNNSKNNLIITKYEELTQKLNNEKNKLLDYYNLEKIKEIQNNYENELNSKIKGIREYAKIYNQYLNIKDEYENYLECKQLENTNEIKLYINKKNEELKYYLLNKDSDHDLLIKDILELNKKLKKYEEKYELLLFCELFIKNNNKINLLFFNINQLINKNNLEIFNRLFEKKNFIISGGYGGNQTQYTIQEIDFLINVNDYKTSNDISFNYLFAEHEKILSFLTDLKNTLSRIFKLIIFIEKYNFYKYYLKTKEQLNVYIKKYINGINLSNYLNGFDGSGNKFINFISLYEVFKEIKDIM